MTIASHIKPCERGKFEEVLATFRHYLACHRDHAQEQRELATNALESRADVVAAYRIEYRKLNEHLRGNGRYSNTGIVLYKSDEPRPEKSHLINLRTHANGVPVQWRSFPLPEDEHAFLHCPDNVPDYIQLQLEIMSQAA